MTDTTTITETRTEPRDIPVENVPALMAKVDELNKRAKRLNVAPLRVEIIDTKVVERKDDVTGLTYTSTYRVVEIVGESPVLEGWTLVARLTPAEGVEGENFVKCVPGLECPPEYRTVDMKRCDHCNTRRNRKDTFVVRHDDGRHMVVGRNCIADFLGHANPDHLLNCATILLSIDELLDGSDEGWYGGGGRFEYHFPTELFVGMTAIFMRRFGWTPRSKSDDFHAATADEVWSFLMPEPDRANRDAKRKFAEKHNLFVTDDDREVAAKAIEWARAIDREKANDYLYNLSLGCSAETVKWKTRGIVASVIAAYNRHVEKLVEAANRRKATANSVHLGEKGGRYVFPDCTVLGTRYFENDWGVKTLVRLRTPGGSVVKWWASGDVADDFLTGDTVTITGTVKDHDEYNGVAETIVNRCKIGVSGKAKPVEEPNTSAA